MFDFNALNKTVDSNIARVHGGWGRWNDKFVRKQLDRTFSRMREKARAEQLRKTYGPSQVADRVFRTGAEGDYARNRRVTFKGPSQASQIGGMKINRLQSAEPGSIKSTNLSKTPSTYYTPSVRGPQFGGSAYPAFRTTGLPSPKGGMPSAWESIRAYQDRRLRSRTPAPKSWQQTELPIPKRSSTSRGTQLELPVARRSNLVPRSRFEGRYEGPSDNQRPGQMALFQPWGQQSLPMIPHRESTWTPPERTTSKVHQYKIPYKGTYKGNKPPRKPLPPM